MGGSAPTSRGERAIDKQVTLGVPRGAGLDFESQSVTSAGGRQRTKRRYARRGSVSPTVFPASGLAGLGGWEPVAEGDGECVDGGLPSHGPPGLSLAGGVEGAGGQVEAL